MMRLALSLALLAGFLLACRAAWRWCELTEHRRDLSDSLTEQRESLNTEGKS